MHPPGGGPPILIDPSRIRPAFNANARIESYHYGVPDVTPKSGLSRALWVLRRRFRLRQLG
jgi:hypothetical protein